MDLHPFDFNSASLKTQFESSMAGLATCIRNGAFRGDKVLLVGRADPQLTEDYNLALGGRRAASVVHALETLGVPDSSVDITSRGALDAIGTNEATWAKDRRVDIKLESHAT